MIVVEYDPDGVVEITVDEEGRGQLMAVLDRLSADDHEHFLSSEWGGAELTHRESDPELVPVHKLTISVL